MSVEMEDAIETLQLMFSLWDRDTLLAVLEANDGHMERTIDELLRMDVPDKTTSFSFSSSSSGMMNKKRVCHLEDDFLRVPGTYHVRSEQEVQDEMLAMMLQDEIFRQELFADDELASHFDSASNAPRQQSFSSSTTSAADALQNMGEKIASMSETMKSKLFSMYQRFQNRNDPAYTTDRYSQVPLMAREDEDDHVELHTFQRFTPSGNTTSRRNLRDGHSTEMRSFTSSGSTRSMNKKDV